jgi:DNA-directed RNA polymerase subunit RPC12/RpoP
MCGQERRYEERSKRDWLECERCGGRRGCKERQLEIDELVWWCRNLVKWKFPGLYDGQLSEDFL